MSDLTNTVQGSGVGRPILFSAPMVRALLAGTKTQTRRIITDGNIYDDISGEAAEDFELRGWDIRTHGDAMVAVSLRIKAGDSLWVRENLKRAPDLWTYSADGSEVGWPARQALGSKRQDYAPSIHMPKAVSRLTLTVTDVRVQRLQDISEEDAQAEGAVLDETVREIGGVPTYRGGFARIWAGIHPPSLESETCWGRNPWVAAYTFAVEHQNIDAALKAVSP